MTKTTKSILKRMRFTKQGKIMRPGSGVNHFQAKKRRSVQMHKKRSFEFAQTQQNALKAYLYH